MVFKAFPQQTVSKDGLSHDHTETSLHVVESFRFHTLRLGQSIQEVGPQVIAMFELISIHHGFRWTDSMKDKQKAIQASGEEQEVVTLIYSRTILQAMDGSVHTCGLYT